MTHDELEESQIPTPAKNTMRVFATQLTNRILQVISGILVAVFLEKVLFGHYRVLLLFGEFLVPLSSMGLISSSVYYLSNKSYRPSDISFTCFGIGALHGVIAASGLALLWRYDCLGIVSEIPKPLVISAFILMPIQGANVLLSQVLIGDSQFSLNNKLMLMRRITLSSLLILLVIVFQLQLLGAVIAVVLSQSIFFIAMLFCIWNLYSPALTLNHNFLKVGYLYGLKSWVGILSDSANKRVDHLLLIYLVDSASYGIYALATTLSEMIWSPLNAVSPVLLNSIAAEKGTKLQISLLSRVHRVTVWFMGSLTLLAGGIGYFLIPLVFEEFSNVALIFLLLLPSVISKMFSMVITRFFYAIGRPARSSAVHLLSAVVGILLYLILVPFWGVVGAAVATSVSYATSAVLAIGMFYYTTKPFNSDSRLFSFDVADIKWLFKQLKSGVSKSRKAN